MVKKYQLSMEQHQVLSKICRQNNVMFCSTPFSVEEAEFLDSLNVPFFKVASMDINHPRLLRCIASKQKPVILSTGMATLSEIDNAVRIIESENNRNIIILHCISLYPPAPEDIHLNNIKTLMSAFPDYPIGFSDHSIGTSIPLGATALGAAVIEKHFTLDKNMEGWDHEISADPSELSYLVKESAFLVKAMGNTKRIVSKTEQEKLKKFRRSIVLARDMKAGEKIEATDLNFKRPGTHISPDLEPYVVGRTLKKALNSDDLVSFEDLE
jgi:sialic acid synthase SpsE